jgi:nicotinate-nucleotide adenylyltransferase
MRVGIFGGPFDPPHVGHQILASEAYDQLRLDRLLWVLTPDPPHKLGKPVSPAGQRLELVQAAIEGNPIFDLSRVEIDRPGPHFAVDTVRLLREQFPKAELFYLIGGDSLHDMPTWHNPRELVLEVDGFGVMRRPGDAVDLDFLEAELPGVTARCHFFSAPLLEISASEIRERIEEGRPFRYYLPPSVYELIVAQNLYAPRSRDTRTHTHTQGTPSG